MEDKPKTDHHHHHKARRGHENNLKHTVNVLADLHENTSKYLDQKMGEANRTETALLRKLCLNRALHEWQCATLQLEIDQMETHNELLKLKVEREHYTRCALSKKERSTQILLEQERNDKQRQEQELHTLRKQCTDLEVQLKKQLLEIENQSKGENRKEEFASLQNRVRELELELARNKEDSANKQSELLRNRKLDREQISRLQAENRKIRADTATASKASSKSATPLEQPPKQESSSTAFDTHDSPSQTTDTNLSPKDKPSQKPTALGKKRKLYNPGTNAGALDSSLGGEFPHSQTKKAHTNLLMKDILLSGSFKVPRLATTTTTSTVRAVVVQDKENVAPPPLLKPTKLQ